MNTVRLALLGISTSITLGACSSSGGSSSDEDPQTAAELSDQIEQLFRDVQAAEMLAPGDLPGVDAGTVTYAGVLDIDPTDSSLNEVIAEFTLSVGFDDGAINGTVTNLVSEDEERYSGSLDVIGTLDRNATNSIDANVSGTITNADGQLTTVSATADGAFFGDNAQYAHGDLDGTIAGGDYPDAGVPTLGSYYSERE